MNLVALAIPIAIAIFFFIAGSKVLSKAGESGWKILIPMYGLYCLYKIADAKGIFWGTLAVSFGSAAITSISVVQSASSSYYGYYGGSSTPTIVPIITIIFSISMYVLGWTYSKRMAEAFGMGSRFAVGLFLLPGIFFPILGFGSAEYVGYHGMEAGGSTAGNWKCPSCGTENPNSCVRCQGCGQVK